MTVFVRNWVINHRIKGLADLAIGFLSGSGKLTLEYATIGDNCEPYDMYFIDNINEFKLRGWDS